MSVSGNASYSVSSDYAQGSDPRVYDNRVAGSLNTSVPDRSGKDDLLQLGTQIGVSYRALSAEVERASASGGETFELSDLEIWAGRDFDLGRVYTTSNRLDLTAGNTFPFGTSSRLEGYKSIPFASAGLTTSFFGGRASFNQSVSTGWVANIYAYSPSTLEPNPDLSVSYSASLSNRPVKWLNLTLGGSVKSQRWIESGWTAGWSAFQAVSFTLNRWRLMIRHTNGGHSLEEKVDLWFIDRYRRLTTASLSVGF